MLCLVTVISIQERMCPHATLKNDQYTSEDYWNLPEGTRAELIDGKFYDMAPPSRIHQEISYQLSRVIGNYIAEKGKLQSIPRPIRCQP